MYAAGVYRNLNNRQLTRKLAWIDLSLMGSSGPEVAFVKIVPAGTIMTIVGPAPKRFPLPFFANRYYVRLEPNDLPSDLDIILQLNRGIEKNMDGLNPDLFSRAVDSTKQK
jgi:hypothetical protein